MIHKHLVITEVTAPLTQIKLYRLVLKTDIAFMIDKQQKDKARAM